MKWRAYLMSCFRATAADVEMSADRKNDEGPKQSDTKNNEEPKQSGVKY